MVPMSPSKHTTVPALEALERLREGNQRFAAMGASMESYLSRRRREELVSGQAPVAIVLGCSDSRVPVEIVFDQGFGDLFVIRVAGNVVQPSQVGSVEFAAEQFGTRLVVVLGHTRCGAVQATLDQLQRPGEEQSRGLRSIVDRIKPSVEGLLNSELRNDPVRLEHAAMRANVRASVAALRAGSEIVDRLCEEDGLLIVGAEYALETGEVSFLDPA
jgi:carbonic anhydrase